MESIRSKVIGLGGAGCNAVKELLRSPNAYLSYAVIDTDINTLKFVDVDEKVMIGHSIMRGLSSGGDLELAFKAAECDKEKIEALIENVDLLFLIVGLGGGVGSALATMISQMAAKQNTVVIVFAVLPFTLEGGKKHQMAQQNLGNLRGIAHATITVPNDLLLQNLPVKATVFEAFQQANAWIRRAIDSMTYMLYKPGIINLDFSSLNRVFAHGGGQTIFGFGEASGVDCVARALNELTLCPLLHIPNAGQRADNLLINIRGGRNLSLQEINNIGSFLASHFNSKDNMAIGAIIDEGLEDFIEIVVIGTTDIHKGSVKNHERSRVKSGLFEQHEQQLLFEEFPLEVKSKRKKSVKKHIPSDPTDVDGVGQRGYFGHSERILINGEDIDIPTYLRKGIKIGI